MFNFEHLDILCTSIEHPSQKLWPFELFQSFSCSLSSVSLYYMLESDIWVKSYGRLNLPCDSKFNSKHLDILCAWIAHPIEKLWPFEFLESFRCSISSLLIYYLPESDFRVKSYGHLNLPCVSLFNFQISIYYAPESHIRVNSYDLLNFSRASFVQFQASRYIICLNHISESNVMAVWISLGLPCLILSISIYYAPESNIRVKSYDDLSCSRGFVVQFQVSRYIICMNQTFGSKVMADWICLVIPSLILTISIYYVPESDI